MDPFINSLINAGGIGILAAALLYLHATSLKEFRAELAAERAARSFELAEERAAHAKELAAERDVCDRRHVENLERLGALHTTIMAEFRDQRYALKDLANAAKLRQALAEQQRPPSQSAPGSP